MIIIIIIMIIIIIIIIIIIRIIIIVIIIIIIIFIIFVAHHRWLVPMWSADLQRRLLLAQRLGVASAIVAQVSVRNFRDAPRIVKSCTYIHSLRQMPPEAGGVSWVDCRKHQFHLSYFRGSSSLVGSYMVC